MKFDLIHGIIGKCFKFLIGMYIYIYIYIYIYVCIIFLFIYCTRKLIMNVSKNILDIKWKKL